MTKRKNDHDVADEIVALLESEGDRARHPGAKAESLLQQAVDAGDGGLRMQYLEQAQREIAKLDPARHGRLINQLQSTALALQGRRGDTQIAHVTPGEIVVPPSVLTPELRRDLAAAARNAGIDPRSLIVGSDRNAINPRTGQMEFASGFREYPSLTDPSVPWWAPDSRVVPQPGPQHSIRPATREQYEAQTHPATSMDSFKVGVQDPINASVQDTLHALPSSLVGSVNRAFGAELAPTADQYDRQLQETEKQYQTRRAAVGQTGTDVWRGLGNVVGEIPADAIRLPVKAGGWVAAGADALTGFANGIFTDPVTDSGDNFSAQKVGQGLEGAAKEVFLEGLRRKFLGK